ncbi:MULTISPECIES: MarR family winged helix-turn-helix transcriptional regulator [Pseudomonas]|jgi:MarR family transcriptional regulator, temperature-dependent positive regulator of motility|uniref:MarR family winged helix-turn-helix transcriptional regulator n=1 Tax=Pseudomonas TaxID=286 RepID=UPI00257F800F|nr:MULTISPECIES: MarR family transcriptional regulator [Pseudomonas]
MTLRDNPDLARSYAPNDCIDAIEEPQGQFDLLNGTLGYAIKRAQMRSVELLGEMINASGLTPAKMTALSLIGTESGISQSALGEKLSINRASVVKVVDTLEVLGFVVRHPTPGDRRSHSLALTNEGKIRLGKLHAQVQEFEQSISSKLSVEERSQLISLLERVAVQS